VVNPIDTFMDSCDVEDGCVSGICVGAGDLDAECIDAAYPETGYSCVCSYGYELNSDETYCIEITGSLPPTSAPTKAPTVPPPTNAPTLAPTHEPNPDVAYWGVSFVALFRELDMLDWDTAAAEEFENDFYDKLNLLEGYSLVIADVTDTDGLTVEGEIRGFEGK